MDASPFVPAGADLAQLRAAAAECRGCPFVGPAGRELDRLVPDAIEREAFAADVAAFAAAAT